MTKELIPQEFFKADGKEQTALTDIIKDVQNKSMHIPFGRSNFQLENFVIAACKTPERAYLQILMELNDRTQSLMLARNNYRKSQRDLKRKLIKLEDPKLDDLDREDIQDEIEAMQMGEPMMKKLVIDALEEVNYLYAALQGMPEFTREQFEAGEQEYYMQKLLPEAAGVSGAQIAINNITQDKYILQQALKTSSSPQVAKTYSDGRLLNSYKDS